METKKSVTLSLGKDLLIGIDERRGLVSRSAFVENLIRQSAVITGGGTNESQ